MTPTINVHTEYGTISGAGSSTCNSMPLLIQNCQLLSSFRRKLNLTLLNRLTTLSV